MSKKKFSHRLTILRALCIEHNLTLISNNDNYVNMSSLFCVLSLCVCEIGLPISRCNIESESYYMNEDDYKRYMDITK